MDHLSYLVYSVYLCILLNLTPFVSLSLSVCIYVYIYIYIYLIASLSPFPSTYLHLSTYLSTYLPINLPIYLSTCLPIHPSIHPSIHLPTYLSSHDNLRHTHVNSIIASKKPLKFHHPQFHQPWTDFAAGWKCRGWCSWHVRMLPAGLTSVNGWGWGNLNVSAWIDTPHPHVSANMQSILIFISYNTTLIACLRICSPWISIF